MKRSHPAGLLPVHIRYILFALMTVVWILAFSAGSSVYAAEDETETDVVDDEDEEPTDPPAPQILTSPDLVITERVLDSAGNEIDGAYARLGDTLTIVVQITNRGDGDASSCVFSGSLENLSYYSLSVTDGNGNDVAAHSNVSDGSISVGFGSGAGDGGGVLASQRSVTIRIRAGLRASGGETVRNQSMVEYRNAAAGILDFLGSSVSSNTCTFQVDSPQIQGTVWIDANNDGIIGDNEYRMPGQTMILQVMDSDGAYNNYTRGGSEVTAVTGSDGVYTFDAVPAGVYRVVMQRSLFEAGISSDTGTPTVSSSRGMGQRNPNNNAVNLISDPQGSTLAVPGIDFRVSNMRAASGCWCDYVDFGIVPIVSVRQEIYINDAQEPADYNGGDSILVWPGYTVRFRLIVNNPTADMVGQGPTAEQLTLRGGVSVTEILPAGMAHTGAAGLGNEVNGTFTYEEDSSTGVWNPAALGPGETYLEASFVIQLSQAGETYETRPDIRTGGGAVYAGNMLVLECGNEGLLAVAQKVSGDFANMTRAFSYTIVIGDADTPLGQWIATIDRADGSQETVFIKAGEPVCISLKNNEDIRIPHVPVSAAYSIGQVPVYNYTASATCVIDGSAAEGGSVRREGRLFYDGVLMGNTTAVTYTDEHVTLAPSVTNGILMGSEEAAPAIKILKVLETKSKNEALGTDFTFELTPVSVGDGSAALMPVLEPVNIAMSGAEDLGKGQGGTRRIFASAPLPIEASAFPHAGIFTYSLTEDSTAPFGNIAYSGEEYILKFYVANGVKGLYIRYVEYWMNGDYTETNGDEEALAAYFTEEASMSDSILDSDGDGETKEVTGIVFHNRYEPTTSLQVKNTLRGGGADPEKLFGCTVKLELPDKKMGTRSYTAFIFNEDGTVAASEDGRPLTVVFDAGNGNTATGAFSLKGGQYLSFVSLKDGKEQNGILPLGTRFGVMEGTVENYRSSVSMIVDGQAVNTAKAADGFYYGTLNTATVPGENCLNIVRTSERYSISEAVRKGLPYGLAFALLVVVIMIVFRMLTTALAQRRRDQEEDFDDDSWE